MDLLTHKTCNKCNSKLTIDCFCKRKDSPDGYRNSCKECRKIQNNQWRNKNKDKRNAKQRANYPKYKDSIAKRGKKYYQDHKEEKLLKCKEYYQEHREEKLLKGKKHYQNNKIGYYVRSARRRALKIQATPSWLTNEQLEDIRDIYRDAYECRWLNEEPLHVDHIIPLNSDLVCGLHVPWNLQILTASENLKKGNKVFR